MNNSPNILLLSACPSIQYRIRKEILGQSSFEPEMIHLQNQFLQEDRVKEILHSQNPDGWLAWAFHGYNSMEAGIRILCEKGVEPTQPVLTHALDSLEKHTDRLVRGLGKVGNVLDELGFGGAKTIRAYLFAQAGKEDPPFVQEQVNQALEVFGSVIRVRSLEDLCEPYKGKLVFREGICFPSIYHLRILAMTQSWRTSENYRRIVKDIKHLVQLSPIPPIHVRYKSRWIAPASFCMDNFKPNMGTLTDAEWMRWFHRMELLARLGVANQIPELKKQIHSLEKILKEGLGLFRKKLNHPYFQKWGSYTGLALEKDWHQQQCRINDLTFRSLLILHYTNLNSDPK